MEMIERIQTMAKLTEWEDNFIMSVKQQLEVKGTLSPRQAEIVERIHNDKT